MTSRNSLGGAYDAAYAATNLAADITLFLDIASKRFPLAVDDHQWQELQAMFRKFHWRMYEAEITIEKTLETQVAAQPAQPAEQRPGHARRRGRR